MFVDRLRRGRGSLFAARPRPGVVLVAVRSGGVCVHVGKVVVVHVVGEMAVMLEKCRRCRLVRVCWLSVGVHVVANSCMCYSVWVWICTPPVSYTHLIEKKQKNGKDKIKKGDEQFRDQGKSLT